MTSQRSRVIQLYKTLSHLGREYPTGEQNFHVKLHAAFVKNRHVTDTQEVETLIAGGEYVIKELEAMYMLRKYRHLKRAYYTEHQSWAPRYLP